MLLRRKIKSIITAPDSLLSPPFLSFSLNLQHQIKNTNQNPTRCPSRESYAVKPSLLLLLLLLSHSHLFSLHSQSAHVNFHPHLFFFFFFLTSWITLIVYWPEISHRVLSVVHVKLYWKRFFFFLLWVLNRLNWSCEALNLNGSVSGRSDRDLVGGYWGQKLKIGAKNDVMCWSQTQGLI